MAINRRKEADGKTDVTANKPKPQDIKKKCLNSGYDSKMLILSYDYELFYVSNIATKINVDLEILLKIF